MCVFIHMHTHIEPKVSLSEPKGLQLNQEKSSNLGEFLAQDAALCAEPHIALEGWGTLRSRFQVS